MDCESQLQLQQQYRITEFGRSADFPRIPWNFAETWKFRGNGQIPRLGSKFRGSRKTVHGPYKSGLRRKRFVWYLQQIYAQIWSKWHGWHNIYISYRSVPISKTLVLFIFLKFSFQLEEQNKMCHVSRVYQGAPCTPPGQGGGWHPLTRSALLFTPMITEIRPVSRVSCTIWRSLSIYNDCIY